MAEHDQTLCARTDGRALRYALKRWVQPLSWGCVCGLAGGFALAAGELTVASKPFLRNGVYWRGGLFALGAVTWLWIVASHLVDARGRRLVVWGAGCLAAALTCGLLFLIGLELRSPGFSSYVQPVALSGGALVMGCMARRWRGALAVPALFVVLWWVTDRCLPGYTVRFEPPSSPLACPVIQWQWLDWRALFVRERVFLYGTAILSIAAAYVSRMARKRDRFLSWGLLTAYAWVSCWLLLGQRADGMYEISFRPAIAGVLSTIAGYWVVFGVLSSAALVLLWRCPGTETPLHVWPGMGAVGRGLWWGAAFAVPMVVEVVFNVRTTVPFRLYACLGILVFLREFWQAMRGVEIRWNWVKMMIEMSLVIAGTAILSLIISPDRHLERTGVYAEPLLVGLLGVPFAAEVGFAYAVGRGAWQRVLAVVMCVIAMLLASMCPTPRIVYLWLFNSLLLYGIPCCSFVIWLTRGARVPAVAKTICYIGAFLALAYLLGNGPRLRPYGKFPTMVWFADLGSPVSHRADQGTWAFQRPRSREDEIAKAVWTWLAFGLLSSVGVSVADRMSVPTAVPLSGP